MGTDEQLLLDYIDSLIINRSENTVAVYKRILNNFMAFLRGHEVSSLSEVTARILTQYFLDSPCPVAHSAIRGFFEYLCRPDIRALSVNPMVYVERPKKTKKLPVVPTEEDIRRVMNAVDLSSPMGLRNLAILQFLYSTGCRVSEVTGVKIEDINWENDCVIVTGKGDEEKIVCLTPEASQCIRSWMIAGRYKYARRDKPSYLFITDEGGKMSRGGIWEIIKRAASNAGLERPISPHKFRHGFATHMLENGADIRTIQALLGHKNIESTTIYTRVSMNHLKDTMRKYHPSTQAIA